MGEDVSDEALDAVYVFASRTVLRELDTSAVDELARALASGNALARREGVASAVIDAYQRVFLAALVELVNERVREIEAEAGA